MNDKGKEVAEIPNGAVSVVEDSPMSLAHMAISNGTDLDQVAKMLELQERFDAMQAKKAYTKAMAAFKANPPKIGKDKTVSYNNTRYSHASLGNVTETINAGLAEHGLSAAWTTDQEQATIKVTCTITHKTGHSESTSLSAGADNSGKKNNIQAIGSTITYLQRYTLLALTGLATHDQDDDAKTADLKLIDGKQVSTITDMMNEHIADHDDFLKWAGVESIDQIPASDYGRIISAIKSVIK